MNIALWMHSTGPGEVHQNTPSRNPYLLTTHRAAFNAMGRPPFPVSARPATCAQAAMNRPPRRTSSSGHCAVSPYERGREST